MSTPWRFTFLGTGTSQGIPVIGCRCGACLSQDPRDARLRCSAWISSDQANVLIDAGPDFRQQALSHNIDTLDAVLITHEHIDHVGGMDDLRPIIFRQKEKLGIYAEDRVVKDLAMRYHYAFEEQQYPGAPRFESHEVVPGDILAFKDIKVEVVRALHGRLPILGYVIQDQLAYLTDTSKLPDETRSRISGIDTLVIDMLREQPHHSHNHLEQAVEMAVNIGARRTFFLHMSHLLGPVAEWEGGLPQQIEVAYDGLVLDF